MSVQILVGDCRTLLAQIPDKSVQMCCTSPPYFGLRDYGVGGQIGLEATPDAFVAQMVDVFREVRRVLKDDGTLWLNLGDSYAHSLRQSENKSGHKQNTNTGSIRRGFAPNQTGLKEKDLIGIPWRVAFALQTDGWCLRQEIIWQKPNPMPESVQDRCTKSHEQIFLFCKAKWNGTYPSRLMKRDDARWLALLVEAEGNIAVKRYTHGRDTIQHALQIAVANSDRSILEEAQRIAGCGSILEAKGTNRPVYYLQWTTKEAASLLWELYPFMFGKKRQAAIGLMLEARRDNANKGQRDDIFFKEGRHYRLQPAELELREKMWKAVKSLNKQQPVDLSWLQYPKEGTWSTERYYYDSKAIAEPVTESTVLRLSQDVASQAGSDRANGGTRADRPMKALRTAGNKSHKLVTEYEVSDSEQHRTAAGLMKIADVAFETRNKRSVWSIATAPFSEAHFATFPPELPEICIKAGSKPGDTILDPFGGAGTTGLVADRLGRSAILLELNPQYAEMARRRIVKDAPLFAEVAS
jgi:DNA modification methylase